MKCKVLTCKLILDVWNEVLLGTHDLAGMDTFIFDLPREDYNKYKDARIQIDISETEDYS